MTDVHLRILILDDDLIFLRALARKLRAEGHEVTALSEPTLFFEAGGAELVADFDVAILDLEMKDHDMVALGETMTGLVDVVFHSGTGDDALRRRAKAVATFTSKDQGDALMARLERVAETKKAETKGKEGRRRR
ncbi:MAG: response regulator [Myxococcota bacterium]